MSSKPCVRCALQSFGQWIAARCFPTASHADRRRRTSMDRPLRVMAARASLRWSPSAACVSTVLVSLFDCVHGVGVADTRACIHFSCPYTRMRACTCARARVRVCACTYLRLCLCVSARACARPRGLRIDSHRIRTGGGRASPFPLQHADGTHAAAPEPLASADRCCPKHPYGVSTVETRSAAGAARLPLRDGPC